MPNQTPIVPFHEDEVVKAMPAGDREMSAGLTLHTRINALLLDCGLAAQSSDENLVSRGRRLASYFGFQFVSVLAVVEEAEIMLYGAIVNPRTRSNNYVMETLAFTAVESGNKVQDVQEADTRRSQTAAAASIGKPRFGRCLAKFGLGTGSVDRDRFTFALLIIVISVNGVFYGLSPLVLPVSEVFDKNGGESYTGGIFLYGFGVLFIGISTGGVAVIDLLNHRPWLRKPILISGMIAQPASLAFLAFMVHIHSLLGLLFAFLIYSYPMIVCMQYFVHVEMPIWYGEEITKGSALCGFATGIGAVFYTVSMGEMIDYLGSENVVAVILIVALVSGVPCILVLIFCNPANLDIGGQKKEAPQPGEIDVAESVHPKKSWVGFFCSDPRPKMFTYIIIAFVFAGISMKMLLSTLFKSALQLSYVDATRLAAACLLMYLPGRGLSPLFCSKDHVFTLFTVILIFEAFAYAATPWAISLGTKGNKELALGVYTSLRLISGGGFAVLLGNIGVLVVRVFKENEIHHAIAAMSAFEWVAGVGPSVAWTIHVEARKTSHTVEEETGSFDGFFYLCAGIALSAALCTALLKCNSPQL